MPFPNSPNIILTLLKVKKYHEKYEVTNSKQVVGIVRSLTRDEWKASVETKINIDYKVSLNAFLYDNEKFVKVDKTFYKVERTYVGGQFVELYLNETRLAQDDFFGELPNE